MNLIRDYNMKASFFSPEHNPMALHQTTFIEKFLEETFGKTTYNRKELQRRKLKGMLSGQTKRYTLPHQKWGDSYMELDYGEVQGADVYLWG
jgi:hypothetical protein